jgi:hypothetical protein
MKCRPSIFLIGLLIILDSCIGGGTHGSIEVYEYNVPKSTLEKAVREVITANSAIRQDSVKDYYNDDTTYLTISILQNGEPYRYTFRYGGGKEYWDTSKKSSIFIAYAYDDKGNGGSEGNGGVTWSDFRLKKKLTKPFEREVVNKINALPAIKKTRKNKPVVLQIPFRILYLAIPFHKSFCGMVSQPASS